MRGFMQAKPLILIFPFGLLSHYLRSLVLCRYLKAYFEIRILYNPAFNSFVVEEAVATFDCESIDANTAIQSMKKFDFSWINTKALERVFLEQIKTITILKPIAVLGDHSPTLKMAAEKTGVQFISLINGYMSKYYADQRGIPSTHPFGPVLNLFPRPLAKILTKAGEAKAFRKIHRPFAEIRKKYQLQYQYQYQDEFEGDLTLICDLPDLFPQKNLPRNYREIAPLIYGLKGNNNIRPSWLPKKQQTIFVSMGSTGDWEKLSFLNDPIFNTYNIIASDDKKRILHASHIIHRSFVNIHELFLFTDLVICHGGNGTIYQALLYRIPVLCKPSHCEQEWNIHAIEKKCLGKNLNRIKDLIQYKGIIEEWIQKKTDVRSQDFSESIEKQVQKLPQLVKQIAATILKKSTRKLATVQQANIA